MSNGGHRLGEQRCRQSREEYVGCQGSQLPVCGGDVAESNLSSTNDGYYAASTLPDNIASRFVFVGSTKWTGRFHFVWAFGTLRNHIGFGRLCSRDWGLSLPLTRGKRDCGWHGIYCSHTRWNRCGASWLG